MLVEWLRLAMVAPGRQRVLRWTVAARLVVLAAFAIPMAWAAPAAYPQPLLGHALQALALIEGATLLGWRLTQWPKSQSLEFLLVSPQSPPNLLGMEALAGIGRLALVTLSGLPVLVLLAAAGMLDWLDVPVLLLLPFGWGMMTGLALTAWAYEARAWRRWGERVLLGAVLLYLTIGVLAGEKLLAWCRMLPEGVGRTLIRLVSAFHLYNPFGVMQSWLDHPAGQAWTAVVAVGVLPFLLASVFLGRAAWRLKGHFHDRHYRPILDVGHDRRGHVGDSPLTSWAVRRVMEYSGRVNIWLAGGFGILFAAYVLAGDAWPPWLGRSAFDIIDGTLGGIAGLATGMVVLSAVPAAFQYGLWDSSPHERCKRLELLLLTELEGRDFGRAAWAAAWRRGRGYFFVANVLWAAAVVAGKATLPQALAALASACTLVAFSFALGFRAFTRGMKANGLGMLLTVGLPGVAVLLWRLGQPGLAALTPPGSVYAMVHAPLTPTWWAAPLGYALAAFLIARPALADCTTHLRAWYSQHHGQRAME